VAGLKNRIRIFLSFQTTSAQSYLTYCFSSLEYIVAWSTLDIFFSTLAANAGHGNSNILHNRVKENPDFFTKGAFLLNWAFGWVHWMPDPRANPWRQTGVTRSYNHFWLVISKESPSATCSLQASSFFFSTPLCCYLSIAK